MVGRISDRVDQLLDAVLSLKREVAETGHRTGAASPNFVKVIAEAPGHLGPQPMSQPYEVIAPGLTVGFRKGAKPDLHLRPTAEGALEIELRKQTTSGWVTLEMEWNPAVLREKQRATLLLRGTSPEPLALQALLRSNDAQGAQVDVPLQVLELGTEPRFHALTFDCPPDMAAQAEACRVIVFCPLQPFAMTLTELSIL